MLHVIFTQLRLGHLSAHAGDSLRRSEEIVIYGIAPFNVIIIIITNLCYTLQYTDQLFFLIFASHPQPSFHDKIINRQWQPQWPSGNIPTWLKSRRHKAPSPYSQV